MKNVKKCWGWDVPNYYMMSKRLLSDLCINRRVTVIHYLVHFVPLPTLHPTTLHSFIYLFGASSSWSHHRSHLSFSSTAHMTREIEWKLIVYRTACGRSGEWMSCTSGSKRDPARTKKFLIKRKWYWRGIERVRKMFSNASGQFCGGCSNWILVHFQQRS